ncbi:hypothetical protein Hanom_Chr01g00021301 [Helianthus anomalus]
MRKFLPLETREQFSISRPYLLCTLISKTCLRRTSCPETRYHRLLMCRQTHATTKIRARFRENSRLFVRHQDQENNEALWQPWRVIVHVCLSIRVRPNKCRDS